VKKYLAVLFGALFILSFAVTAFAVHDTPASEETAVVASSGAAKITLGGKIIVRGWYFDNVGAQVKTLDADTLGEINTGALPVDTGSQSFYTTSATLTVDAKIGDNVQGFMELESSSVDSNNSGSVYWGTYDSKGDMELKFRQLWIQYTGAGLLGAPSGIKIGHMPIVLGEKQFLNNERFGDDAILLWVDPMKEMHIAIGTTKLNEGNTTIGLNNSTDDLDGYMALMTYMLNKDNTVGINYLLASSNGNLPSLQDWTNGADPGYNNCETLSFQNAGIHANGKLYGISYAAEADMNFGKAENVLGTGSDAKFKGWGVFAKLGYMLDPVNIRGSFAMGSGADKFKDFDDGDLDVDEFQTLQGTDATGATSRPIHYTQIYERSIRTAAAEAVVSTYPGGNIRSTGIANTTYFNLGFDVNPIKEVSVSVDGFFLQATETGAWEDIVGNSVDDSLGWEIDSKINWKIAKNLTYFIEAGFFKPGDFYQDAFGDDVDETVTQAVHGLMLTF